MAVVKLGIPFVQDVATALRLPILNLPHGVRGIKLRRRGPYPLRYFVRTGTGIAEYFAIIEPHGQRLVENAPGGRNELLPAPTSARSASSAVETAIAAAAADISASSGKAGDAEWRQIITRVVDLVLKQ